MYATILPVRVYVKMKGYLHLIRFQIEFNRNYIHINKSISLSIKELELCEKGSAYGLEDTNNNSDIIITKKESNSPGKSIKFYCKNDC